MSLDTFRKQIDELDKELIETLAKRFQVTHQVGEYKKHHKLTSIDSNREKRQFIRYERLAKDSGLNPDLVNRIMRSIIDEVVTNHKKILD